MAQPSFRDYLKENAAQDTTLLDYIQDNLKHRERNRRNLIVAALVFRYLRQEGKTKAWLAERMGVSPQYVGKLLKGKGNMTLESIDKLEQATGLTLLTVALQPRPAAETPAPVAKSGRQYSWQGTLSLAQEFMTANFITPVPKPC